MDTATGSGVRRAKVLGGGARLYDVGETVSVRRNESGDIARFLWRTDDENCFPFTDHELEFLDDEPAQGDPGDETLPPLPPETEVILESWKDQVKDAEHPILTALKDETEFKAPEERVTVETVTFSKQVECAPEDDFPSKSNCLTRAAALVDGPRRETYGHPKDNHARTAAMWSAYLGVPISLRQVCMLNALQKISRDAHAPKEDNLDDICGWTRNAEIVS